MTITDKPNRGGGRKAKVCISKQPRRVSGAGKPAGTGTRRKHRCRMLLIQSNLASPLGIQVKPGSAAG